MGLFVFLPLVLPLTALPIARVAEQHLHPRSTARLLTALGAVLALCSTVCLALLMVVGTAQLPGNPLPDGWSDPEVRAAVPYAEATGTTAIAALAAVVAACTAAVRRHRRVRARAVRALDGLPHGPDVAVLPDTRAYAYALPGASAWSRGPVFAVRSLSAAAVAAGSVQPGRIVVSTGMLDSLEADEQRALLAHERAHLGGRHHRFLLVTHLAARANPLLRPLRAAVAYSTERWADEDAARTLGDRRAVARAVGKAALVSRGEAMSGAMAFASSGPVPRRVAALLDPTPPVRSWPPALTRAGLAVLVAAAGTAASALSAMNAAVALFLVLQAATPL